MPRTTLELSPKVLRWARESAGFDLQGAAEKLKVPPATLRSWEEGEGSPELSVFHKMVTVYRRPPTVFLFSSPPPEKELPQDFRTLGGGSQRLSPDVRFAIRQAEFLRKEISELVKDSPDLLGSKLRLEAATLQDNPEVHAKTLRKQLDVANSEQLQWTMGEAFKNWRAKIQDLGILVFSLKMPLDDCRGFSLNGTALPAIIVNSADESDQAKSFTVFHELGHILLRQPGICNDFSRTTRQHERWCNQFAGSLLIPAALLKSLLTERGLGGTQQWKFSDITELARRFKVSRQAIALRLIDLQIAKPSLYEFVLQELKKEPIKKSKGGPVPPHIRSLSKVGTKGAAVVFGALSQGAIDTAKASTILNLNPKWFNKLHDAIRTASRG
ncbi:MAG: ImmA/IrrE family metallo-endopeptidase [Nitrospirae bacterium]|nr:ImmA/IrrE family metallo-endopeptidase [Nitrospirota bacterium]